MDVVYGWCVGVGGFGQIHHFCLLVAGTVYVMFLYVLRSVSVVSDLCGDDLEQL